MVKKAPPFHADCSSQSCVEVKHQVSNDYDKKVHRHPPQPSALGGVAVKVLEPARVGIIGGRGTYTVSQHGVAVEARRCRQFRYVDRYGKDQKPTCTEKKVFNVPQRTMQCYEQFSELLIALARGKMGAPPTTSNKILALLGCNKSGLGESTVAEPLSPYLIAAVTGMEHNAVRKTMENLVKSRKVTSSSPLLDVVYEKQNKLSPSYARAFDMFVMEEREERKWMAFRHIFGEALTPSEVSLPEAEPQTFMTGKGFKPRKLSQKAIKRAMKEAEEWKIRTGLATPSYKTKRYRARKPPRKADVYKREAMDREWAEAFAE